MPVQWVSRPYRPEDGLAILDLIRNRPTAAAFDYPTLADMQEMLAVPAIAYLTRVWQTTDGAFAGYSCLNAGDDYASLVFEYAVTSSGTELGGLMIAWGEQVYREDYHGQAGDLMTSVRDGNIERIALLEKFGFTRSDEHTVYMERDLHQPISDPRLPEGFSIRCLAGPQEAGAWVALHQAAFGTHNMTVEYRQAMFHTPGYDPALDLVAVAPDGRLAAYVVCAAAAEETGPSGLKTCTTDPVATHPDYQRLGLSRALLLTGLSLLRARGMDTARLGTSSDNLAMRKTAESAGYRVTGHALVYTKNIEGPRLLPGDQKPF